MVSELEAGSRFAERPWVSLPLSEPHVSTDTHGGNIIAVVWVLGLQESLSMSSHDRKEHPSFLPCTLCLLPFLPVS